MHLLNQHRIVDLGEHLPALHVIASLDVNRDDSSGVPFVGDGHVIACGDGAGEGDTRHHGLASRHDDTHHGNIAAVGQGLVGLGAPGQQLPGCRTDEQ